ncbi:MAG TPA: acyltransferase [Rhizomicrobium sp.]
MRAKRLYSLDVLRGLGALAVVFWHWQHFFAIRGTWQAGWSRAAEPSYALLKPLYDQGWLAVDLFFAVSGFVFFWLYLTPVAEKRVGAISFALQRLSRLYPLYLVTLLIAAGLELLFFRATGSYFIFDANDWPHFIRSLFLVQQWLPPDEAQSFNGPAWAVSLEVLLYIVFFVLVRLGLRGPRVTLVLALSATLIFPWEGQIARALAGFFMGGVTWWATDAIASHRNARAIAKTIIAAAAIAWGIALLEVYVGPIEALFPRAPAPMAHFLLANTYPLFLFVFIFGIVPLTLAALALHEELWGGIYARLTFLGDISYSTYLIHFSMQLTLALVALRMGWTPWDFMSGWVMLAFYSVLIALGALSYYGFERPVQAALRKRMARPALSTAQ